VKFTKLTIENFLAISNGEIGLSDRGLVLIQGVNNDDTSAASNGAGKSSLADALCWCLYGVTARGVSGDAVINEVAAKGTKVEVVINDGVDIYTIARHRKHKTGKNNLTVTHLPPTLGATPKDLTKGTDKLTQEIVDKVIGASYDVFKSAVYAGQEQMPDLPAMTDKQLKMLIEEASGVTLLEEAYNQARERLNTRKATHEQFQSSLTRAGERHAQLVADLARAQANQADWEAKRTARIGQLVASAKNDIAQVKAITTAIAALTDPAELEKQIAEVDQKIADVDHENTELAEHNTLVARASAQLASLTRETAAALNRVRTAKAEVEAVQHRIGCACGECGREITADEVAATEAAAKRKLKQTVSEYNDIKRQSESAQKELEKLTDERDAFKASMTDLTATVALRSDLQRSLNEIRSKEAEKKRFHDSATRNGEDAKRVKAEVNPFDAEITRFGGLIDKQLQEIRDAEECVKKSEVDLVHADAAVKVFGPAGVRAFLLDEVTPLLNDRTAHYLTTLSDGNISATWSTLVPNAKGELKEKFSIEVKNEKGSQSFAGLSGGEKRKVRVACALALQDLVATRATKPIDLFIGDEIDHALDEPGLERLTQILEEKASERGSVFVISHSDLSDWISQIVTVKKTGKQSVIEETTV
jgi:DNA repair exonuclease SbcCD ATPase subunit